MGGETEQQDFDEFEMLLCEIPNATSVNPHPEESRHPNSSANSERNPLEEGDRKNSSPATFTNFYQASQAANQGSNAAFCPVLSFERPSATCVNSSQGSADESLQANGIMDGGKLTAKKGNRHSPINNIDRLDPSFQHDQSLTSAFAELSFKDGVTLESPRSLQNVNYKTLQNCTFVLEGQYPNCLKKPLSSGVNMVTATSNGVNKLSAQIKNPGSCQLFDNLSGDLGEQLLSLPMYSAPIPLAHGMHAFQVLSNPVPRVKFPVMPYQLQAQHMSRSPLTLQHMEEERYRRMHQQYLYLQHLGYQGSESHLSIQANGNSTLGSMARNLRQPYLNSSDLTLIGNGVCPHYTQGSCGRGDSCPFAHGQKQIYASGLERNCPALATKDIETVPVMDKVAKHSFPEKILTRSHGLNPIRAIKPGSDRHKSLNYSNANGRALANGNGHFHHTSILNEGSFLLDGWSSRGSSTGTADIGNNNLTPLTQRYNSMDEVTGRIYLMAKDQHGCRFLQRKFAEGTIEDVEKIFVEIIGHIVELMTDPFGNYLVQKLLEVCDDDQRRQIIHAITRKPGDLVRISCDMHGTRAVQKIIETIKTPEQFSMIVSSLKSGIVLLIKDMNGNHVAQRCLQYLMPEYSEFLFKAAISHCVELATDRHGCCVLQKCLGLSDGEHRRHLICEITSNAPVLAQDPFGNYVVQFVFELRIRWATIDLLDQLEGNYGYLSMQKYSSNVVEKCLKYAGEERCPRIIKELINNSRLDQILLDPYGNYVIQAALNQSKGALHAALVEAIKPFVPALRTSPYGKKVLSSNSLKK
ncbi:uncharacterized protein LOC122090970 [Macadamia integrifolia]|uniref:uncharacterized protein LOC122090970 n=1 Tax=Macadamia integrifolia TaxID=60698 RepID=UPI001C4FE572|nr:uncharacterized protein LOC122090970 [Macadamia integrifolia]XP_042516682.1 uncharacterized protein LOC122090970 [Macadamia integrifolia]